MEVHTDTCVRHLEANRACRLYCPLSGRKIVCEVNGKRQKRGSCILWRSRSLGNYAVHVFNALKGKVDVQEKLRLKMTRQHAVARVAHCEASAAKDPHTSIGNGHNKASVQIFELT